MPRFMAKEIIDSRKGERARGGLKGPECGQRGHMPPVDLIHILPKPYRDMIAQLTYQEVFLTRVSLSIWHKTALDTCNQEGRTMIRILAEVMTIAMGGFAPKA